MSSKMLQSYMIQNRVNVNYNTTAINSIHNIIFGADSIANKNLLLSIGYNVYINNYNIVLRSSKALEIS